MSCNHQPDTNIAIFNILKINFGPLLKLKLGQWGMGQVGSLSHTGTVLNLLPITDTCTCMPSSRVFKIILFHLES